VKWNQVQAVFTRVGTKIPATSPGGGGGGRVGLVSKNKTKKREGKDR